MGALTSKPYAFVARPWELRSVENLDFSDFLTARVRIDLRGSDVMRVLPRIGNVAGFEDWITDKTRFSYDGLKRQRLIFPVFLDKPSMARYVTAWDFCLAYLDYLFFRIPSVFFAIGGRVDVLTTILARDLAFSLGTRDYALVSNSFLPRSDFRFGIILDMDKLLSADLVSLISFNPRMYMPVFNSFLRRRVMAGLAAVISFGPALRANYDIFEAGFAYSDYLYGRSSWSTLMARAAAPVLLAGPSSSSMPFPAFTAFLSNLFPSLYSFFLQPAVSSFIASELGVRSAFFDFAPDIDTDETYLSEKILRTTVYLIDCDDVARHRPSFNFLIYQGHHGDKMATKANIVLPATAPYEMDSLHLTSRGLLESSSFLTSSPIYARPHWQILLTVWVGYLDRLVLPFGLEYLTSSAYRRDRVLAVFPLLASNSPLDLASLSQVYFPIFLKGCYGDLAYGNFYMTDTTSRVSRNMALASSRFRVIRELNFL